jgi:hypothetical protein
MSESIAAPVPLEKRGLPPVLAVRERVEGVSSAVAGIFESWVNRRKSVHNATSLLGGRDGLGQRPPNSCWAAPRTRASGDSAARLRCAAPLSRSPAASRI